MNKKVDISIYWNIYEILSYNAVIHMVVGNRSCGKTFGFKKWAIEDFLKTGAQFVYLRRYKTELDEISCYFDDIRSFFPDVDLEVKGRYFFINGKLAGRSVALTVSSTKKGVPMPFVNKLCFDEFLIDNPVYHYLKNEVKLFLNYCFTVCRDRNGVKIFLLANAVTISNVYFQAFRVKLPTNKKLISCNGRILIQLEENEDFKEHMRSTDMGMIVKDMEFGRYAIDNEFMLDNSIFVKKKSQNVKYFCTIVFKGKTLGAWIDRADGKLYMSWDYDPKFVVTYALTTSDHSPNTMLLSQITRCLELKAIRDQFYLANVYFESIDIKNIMYDVIALL
jgi:hypothetical protein